MEHRWQNTTRFNKAILSWNTDVRIDNNLIKQSQQGAQMSEQNTVKKAMPAWNTDVRQEHDIKMQSYPATAQQ